MYIFGIQDINGKMKAEINSIVYKLEEIVRVNISCFFFFFFFLIKIISNEIYSNDKRF